MVEMTTSRSDGRRISIISPVQQILSNWCVNGCRCWLLINVEAANRTLRNLHIWIKLEVIIILLLISIYSDCEYVVDDVCPRSRSFDFGHWKRYISSLGRSSKVLWCRSLEEEFKLNCHDDRLNRMWTTPTINTPLQITALKVLGCSRYMFLGHAYMYNGSMNWVPNKPR